MKILGISLSHDSGVTLLNNDRIQFAVNEERFSRVKIYSGLPEKSLEWMSQQVGGTFKGIDAVGIADIVQREPPPHRSDLSDSILPTWQMALLRMGMAIGIDRLMLGTNGGVATYQAIFRHFSGKPYRRLLQILNSLECRAPIRRYDHHFCHILSALYTAGWDRCLIISLDCFGDGLSGRVSTYENGSLRQHMKVPMFHSIGSYYLFATSVCGFPMGYHCGKTTGLAAYGKGDGPLAYFRKRIYFDERKGTIINCGKLLYNALDEMRRELKDFPREEIAAGVQRITEEVVTAFVRYWMRKTGQTRLAVAGGIFANVKLNQRLASLPEVASLFIHPHMGDGGLPTGAAYAIARDLSHKDAQPLPYRLPHAFLGPDLSSENIPQLIQDAGLKWSKPANIDAEIADLLAHGKVVARVSGPMEYGPRALGHRSILYQATDPTVNTWLNHKLKRSEFMPFAPMILKEDAPALLKNYSTQNAHAAEFMTITYDVSDRCKRESPAVVHVDGTARPQVIEQEINPHCHAILQRYKQKTGLSAIINTSFNMHDEPIVRTAKEAIRAFLLSELDYLVLDQYIVWRRPQT